MLKINAPDYKYCPFCGKELGERSVEGKKFKYCHIDDWTYYPSVQQASTAIVVKDSKVLLVKRNREPHKGKWMFPAGFLNYGESPEECAIRELKEETGLIGKNPVFFGILQSEDDPRSPGHLVFYYMMEADGEALNKDQDENSDIGWFNLTDTPPLAWTHQKKIISTLREEYKLNHS